eukprot:TRINITY_DN4804_c0_g9_i3.p1 TRINITY_DN4804_c0_g9~~TRINITY_DN4804_c0_g9_i3.p1  ORF type:complete len:884 (+),score=333.99 TRINITY_DN4804_c0_g9_i3:71-2722(+)
MESSSFELLVQLPRGSSLTLRVASHMLVAELKQAIARKEEIPKEEFNLSCSGVLLEDNQSLEHYKISKISALSVQTTDKPLTVHVQITANNAKELQVSKYAGVYKIKELIQKEIGMVYAKQRLYFADLLLEDENSLKSYAIMDGSKINFKELYFASPIIFVKTIKGSIVEFVHDPNKRVKELRGELVRVERVEERLLELKHNDKLLKDSDRFNYISRGALLICEHKRISDVMMVGLESKMRELLEVYKIELEPFIKELDEMNIKEVNKLFERARLLIEEAKGLTIIKNGAIYNKEDKSITKAKMALEVLKDKITEHFERQSIIRNNCKNLLAIVSQILVRDHSKFNSYMERDKGLKTITRCKERINSIIKRMVLFGKETRGKMVPLHSYNRDINKRLEHTEKQLTGYEEEMKVKVKKHQEALEIKKELVYTYIKPAECLQVFEKKKIDSTDEASLFDITGIAKGAEAKQEDWLAKDELELNDKINEEIDKPVQIPKTWVHKEKISMTPEILKDSNEFSMKLLKTSMKKMNKTVVFTKSHRTSTLNIHNVHLLASTYSNSKKFRVKLDYSSNNSEKNIFNDNKSRIEFIHKTKQEIAAKLGVNKDFVSIVDLGRGSILMHIVLDMKPEQRELARRRDDLSEAKLTDVDRAKFHESLKELYDSRMLETKSEEIFSTFTFDVNYLDPEYDLEYTEKFNKVDRRGGHPYFLPIGYRRLGIKVKDVYEENDWIEYRDERGWAVGYHGISSSGDLKSPFNPMDHVEHIIRGEKDGERGFNKAKRTARGQGVYCTPDIHVAEKFAVEAELPTKSGMMKYKLVFQCRINPRVTFTYSKRQAEPMSKEDDEGMEGIYVAQDMDKDGVYSKDYWVVKDPKNVRPYGILIKVIK